MSLDDFKEDGKNDGNSDNQQSSRTLGAVQRRRAFKKQLLECEEVHDVVSGPKRNVYQAQTNSGSKLIWMHYNRKFQFWGGGVQKTETLRAYPTKLIHAFLGQLITEFYIISDDELRSGKFYMPVQDKDGNDQWKLAARGDKGRNREILEDSHTDICSCFE